MTEKEWREGSRFGSMLECLGEIATKRKVRLFACGRVRIVWADVIDDRSRRGVGVSECYADGLETSRELSKVWREAHAAYESIWKRLKCSRPRINYCAHPHSVAAFEAQFACGEFCELVAPYLNPEAQWMAEGVEARILRELFGNPFRPVTLDPSWLTSTVLAVAEGIYTDRAFDRLLILADALMDAGCDNPDILDHCRFEGPHVRGCWALDLLTGRS